MERFNFSKIRNVYQYLIDRKRIREDDLDSLQKEINELNLKVSELKWLVDPHVSISKISSSTQKDRYIGKFMVYLDNGKSKQVSVSLGSTDKYKSVEDPILIDYSKKKAIDYLMDKYPEKNKKIK